MHTRPYAALTLIAVASSANAADINSLMASSVGSAMTQPRTSGGNIRSAAGDSVGTDIVVINATDAAFLTDWPGISTVAGGTAFATNALTTDSIEITSNQTDLGGGLFEYTFTYRNVSSTSGQLAEFTPGGAVQIGAVNPPSPITQHQIAIGGFNAVNDNVDNTLGTPLSIIDLNGAGSGNGITTVRFGDGTSFDLGFFATIDGTGVDGQVFVSAGGADLGDFNIVGYDVRIQVQYVPGPTAAGLLALSGLLAGRRRR